MPPYLTKSIIIREYLNLGKISRFYFPNRNRDIRFGWSMCDIRFCISWPEKITRCISHISTDSVRLVDVRCSVLYFLARKITRCISHISTDSVRLVDVRCSVLYFLARKITRCTSHIFLQFVLKGVVPGRVKRASYQAVLKSFVPGSAPTSPRNPRFPIVHFDIQTAFRARVSIFNP